MEKRTKRINLRVEPSLLKLLKLETKSGLSVATVVRIILRKHYENELLKRGSITKAIEARQPKQEVSA